MAKQKSSGGGSTLYGVLAGLLIGLIAAVAVAFYVIKSPMPFVDKASRSPEATSTVDPRNAPDPNAGLAGRGTGPVTAPSSPDQPTGETAATSSSRSAPAPDALGALIATLTPAPSTQQSQPRQGWPVCPNRRYESDTHTTWARKNPDRGCATVRYFTGFIF